MQLSCRARYATRAMIELALHHGKVPLSLAVIAKNEGISQKYLKQLMGPLKRAGLVRVIRGKSGGFVLSLLPSQITLADILYAVEGSMSLLDCVTEPNVCHRHSECMSRATWIELSAVINAYLKSTTLEEVVKKGIYSQMAESVGTGSNDR